MKNELISDQRGSLAYFYVFFILMIILVLIFALFIPMAEIFLTETYTASEGLILDANASAANIQNEAIRTQLQSTYASQTETIPDIIDVLNPFFQFAWILIPVIIAMVLFLAARQQVEAGRGIA